MELINARLANGLWEALVVGAKQKPELIAEHHGQEIASLDLSPHTPEGWRVRLKLPEAVLSDGIQTVLIRDARNNEILTSIAIMAGEVLDADLRAEVSLLRAELDTFKRAFRQHCQEQND